MIAALLWLLSLSPAQAAEVVPQLAGRAHEARVLRAIGKRESYLTRIGVHRGDMASTSGAWSAAVRAGYIDPSECPFHRRSAGWWGTRGFLGHVAAFAAQYLPCAPPQVLDIPAVSAWVALKRLRAARRARAPRRLRAWAEVG